MIRQEKKSKTIFSKIKWVGLYQPYSKTVRKEGYYVTENSYFWY